MLMNIAALIVIIAGIAVLVYLLETYAPGLHALVKAIIIAAFALAVIRTLRAWICSWLCG